MGQRRGGRGTLTLRGKVGGARLASRPQSYATFPPCPSPSAQTSQLPSFPPHFLITALSHNARLGRAPLGPVPAQRRRVSLQLCPTPAHSPRGTRALVCRGRSMSRPSARTTHSALGLTSHHGSIPGAPLGELARAPVSWPLSIAASAPARLLGSHYNKAP